MSYLIALDTDCNCAFALMFMVCYTRITDVHSEQEVQLIAAAALLQRAESHVQTTVRLVF
jgi:hypothetical protein